MRAVPSPPRVGRKSAVADLRTKVPISGKPEIGGAAPADSTHPTGQASGACRLLLIAARRSACHSLPDDDERLARRARLSLRTWRALKPAVMALWTLADGRWRPKRPNAERAVERLRDIVRRNGRRGRALSAAMEAGHGRAAAAVSDGPRRPFLPGAANPADLRTL